MDGGASVRSVCACVPAPLCTLVHPHVGVYTCMRGHRYPCVCMLVHCVHTCKHAHVWAHVSSEQRWGRFGPMPALAQCRHWVVCEDEAQP